MRLVSSLRIEPHNKSLPPPLLEIMSRLSSLLPFPTTLTSSHNHRLLTLLPFSTASIETPPPQPHFMVQYLIDSIGFSQDRAIRTLKPSNPLRRLQTTELPDSVIDFLRKTGLKDTHIKILISWYPGLLCHSVEKTLEPQARALEQDGFSGPLLVQLIRSNPLLLTHSRVLPRLRFWKSFLGDNPKDLLRAFKRNRGIVDYDLDKKIAPNISLLRSYGMSDHDIAWVMTRVNGFILRSPASMKALIERTGELGIPFSSGMFLMGLSAVAMVSSDTLEKKMEMFKSFGWLKSEVISVFKKYPIVLGLSETNLQSKMELFKSFGWSEAEVLSVFKTSPNVLGLSETNIRSKIELFKSFGLLEYEVLSIFKKSPNVLGLSETNIRSKIELFKRFGWLEYEVLSIFKKCPTVLGLSETNLQSKMDFLVKGAGFTHSYIAVKPAFLMYSLEKRLMPRHCVLKVLKSKELGRKDQSLFSTLPCSEKSFLKRFVLPFKKEVPDLHETYIAACAGSVPM